MNDSDAKQSIVEAEQQRQKALVAVDLAALDKLFADDLIHIHSTGLVHDKSNLLRHIDKKRAFLGIERGPLDIRIEGDLAVMAGPMTNRMRSPEGNAEIVLKGFVTQVLRRSEDGWKFIHFQFTPTRES